MLDSLTILSVTIGVLLVVVRAIEMDARLPWFKPRTVRRAYRQKTPADWE